MRAWNWLRDIIKQTVKSQSRLYQQRVGCVTSQNRLGDVTARAQPAPATPHSCYPRPSEKSNLLIVRSGCPQPPGSPAAPRHSLNQMMFHKIDPQSLTQVWG